MEPLNTSPVDSVDKSANVEDLMEQPLAAKGENLVPGTVSLDANNVDVSRDTLGQLRTLDDRGDHNSVNQPIISAPQAQPVFDRGYEHNSGEWEEYSHYINAESIEAGSNGVYNENPSLIFHTGYGYSPQIPPYGPYSPVTTPLPSASGDSQQLYSQQFPFASLYYQQPPPSMPYLTSPTPVSQPDLTIPVEHQGAFVAESLNSNSVPFGPRPDYSLPYGSFGREFFAGNSGFYDLRQGFDCFGSAGFWSDWLKSPDGTGSGTASSSPAASSQPIDAFGSLGHGIRPLLSSEVASQQQKSSYGFGSSISSYDRGYFHGGMYHQGSNFGGSIPSIGTSERGFIAIDKGRRRGKGNVSFCSCNDSLDFLNEQNRGPRSTKPKNVIIEQQLAADSKNDNSTAGHDRELYNRSDFSTVYKDAKFFIIKSYTEDNVHKSIKYGVWASTANGNRKLDSAYHEAKEKGESCAVFLFFSVNASAQFCGVAEMIGPVDFEKSVDYWQQDKWSGQFPVKWHIIKDVPNNLFRHIILENNDNKPVTNSRDTQEVKLEPGLEMLSIFKKYEADMSILDDFDFYEERQKAMQEKKAARQQSNFSTVTVSPVAVEERQHLSGPKKAGGGGGVIINQMSKTFAQVVRLDETSKPAAISLVDRRSSTPGDCDADAGSGAVTDGKSGDSKNPAAAEVAQIST